MRQTSLDKGKIKILLLEGIHSSALETFRREGYVNIECHPKSLPADQLGGIAARCVFHRHPLRKLDDAPGTVRTRILY